MTDVVPKKNRRISVDLPPELVDLVDARAKEVGQSRNTFIVRCLWSGAYPDFVLDADGVLRRIDSELPPTMDPVDSSQKSNFHSSSEYARNSESGNTGDAPKETEMPVTEKEKRDVLADAVVLEEARASVALDGETQSLETVSQAESPRAEGAHRDEISSAGAPPSSLAADRKMRDCPRCHKVRINRGGVWWCPQHGAGA